eukprot:1158612-Pelagomonas_calceolata.AAC.7
MCLPHFWALGAAEAPGGPACTSHRLVVGVLLSTENPCACPVSEHWEQQAFQEVLPCSSGHEDQQQQIVLLGKPLQQWQVALKGSGLQVASGRQVRVAVACKEKQHSGQLTYKDVQHDELGQQLLPAAL